MSKRGGGFYTFQTLAVRLFVHRVPGTQVVVYTVQILAVRGVRNNAVGVFASTDVNGTVV